MKSPRTQLLFGGMDNDYEDIVSRARSGRGIEWEFMRDTRRGDRLLIYFNRPHSEIVATAIALEDKWPGEEGGFRGRMGEIQLLADPIHISELRELFPKWAWLRYPRSKLYLDDEKARILWHRAKGRSSETFRRWRNQGAGFGVAEKNREVEKAAIKRVSRQLKAEGYEVTSRELDREGYDLDAARAGKTWHVEVKGISGSDLAFVITRGEWTRAREDPAFLLYAVTQADEPKAAKTHRFTGKQLVARFEARPISFFLSLKD
jgi:Domain of unknown function (DUF3883)